jgi:hypothetical protein
MEAGIRDHELDAVALDARFSNPGNLGHPLPLVFGRATFTPPAGTLVFHGNFCALEDKDRLLTEVRRLADGGRRVPNRELVAEGPEGLGFFPATCPDRPFDRQSMFAREKARDVLAFVGQRPVRLIVEVGSWLGASTRWFAETFSGPVHQGEEHEHAQIVCIDTWAGQREWEASDLVARERQERAPDVVFIDGDHSYEGCRADVEASVTAWPRALVIGDDYGIKGDEGGRERPVRDAVEDAAEKLGLSVDVGASGIWALSGAAVPPQMREPVAAVTA